MHTAALQQVLILISLMHGYMLLERNSNKEDFIDKKLPLSQ